MAIQDEDLQTVFCCVRLILDACRKAGLSLSKLSASRTIKFAGFIIRPNGISPDPTKLASLRHFPTPKSVTKLKSLLGLANQLGSLLPDLAHATTEMRKLLKKNVAFLWLKVHDQVFEGALALLCSVGIIKPFDISLPTELLTDASHLLGFGFALVQVDFTGELRLVQFGSCALTPAQKSYATLELEASAILWAIMKCDNYLQGMG